MPFNDINLLSPEIDGGSKRQEDRDSYFFGFVMRKEETHVRAIMASLRFLAVLDGKGGDSCFLIRVLIPVRTSSRQLLKHED